MERVIALVCCDRSQELTFMSIEFHWGSPLRVANVTMTIVIGKRGVGLREESVLTRPFS